MILALMISTEAALLAVFNRRSPAASFVACDGPREDLFIYLLLR